MLIVLGCQKGGKSSKLFVNLEKQRGFLGEINKSLSMIKKFRKQKNNFEVSKSPFTRNTPKTSTEYASYLETLDLQKLTEYNMMLCEDNFGSIITMPKNKSPGNEGAIIAFYQLVWHDKKDLYINCISYINYINCSQSLTKASYH